MFEFYGLLFFNPANGTFISSIDYKFQHHVTSGSYFGIKIILHPQAFLHLDYYHPELRGELAILSFSIVKNVYNARTQIGLCDCVLHHVSARGFQSLVAPTSLKNHKTQEPNDKEIWDAAYNKEYDGLVSLPMWEVITEDQFASQAKAKELYPLL
jgi:hypothetical protein